MIARPAADWIVLKFGGTSVSSLANWRNIAIRRLSSALSNLSIAAKSTTPVVIGAVIAERPQQEEEALERYGRNLGIAFQLVDDMLDFSAQPTEFGKSIGNDFRDGKVTLPILLAFARGDEEERAFWRRTIEEQDQRAGDLEQAIHLAANLIKDGRR